MRHLTYSAKQNLGACVAMIAVTAVVVICRFAVRASRRQRPNGSDWTCLSSVPLFYAYCGLIIHFIVDTSLYGDFESNPLTVGPIETRNIMKMTYKTELLFGFVITTVKLSILWFYYTIFAKASTTFNYMVKAIAAICIVWCLITTFIIAFQCSPVRDYWETFSLSPSCMSTPRLLLGYEMTNLFLDVTILCIPIPMVWKLQLGTSRKVGVMAIFLLGGFVCAASIIRITTIWNPPDLMLDFRYSAAMLWSTIQLGVAIVCACLPTLGPFFSFIGQPFVYLGSLSASLFSRSRLQSSRRGHKISEQDEADLIEIEHGIHVQHGSDGGAAYDPQRRQPRLASADAEGVALKPFGVGRNVGAQERASASL